MKMNNAKIASLVVWAWLISPALWAITVPGDQATLQAAYDAATSGDTIEITAAGNYAGLEIIDKDITITNTSGGVATVDDLTTISTTASSTIVFDGITFALAAAGSNINITAAGTVDLTVQNSTFTVSTTGINIDAAANQPAVTVTDTTFAGGVYGILSWGSSDVTVTDVNFDSQGVYCIDMAGNVGSLVARRCRFSGGGAFGPQVHINPFNNAGTVDATFVNCLFVTEEYGSFQADGAGDISFDFCTFVSETGVTHTAYKSFASGTMSVTNCIFDAVTGFQNIYGGTFSDYNLFTGTATHGGGATAGSNDIIDGTPAFVGSGDDPYAIGTGSDAIDAADPGATILRDILLNWRNIGARDMGAYEFGAVPVELSGFSLD